jgi:phospholipid transport system substrate-binding protein
MEKQIKQGRDLTFLPFLVKIAMPCHYSGKAGRHCLAAVKQVRCCLVFFLILCHFVVTPALANTISSPWEQLEQTIEKAIDILLDLPEEKKENRPEKILQLCDVVYERFNLAKTARLSLVDHWEKRTGPEKKEFIALFGKLLESAYLSKADQYQDEQVVFVKETRDGTRAQVHVRVIHRMLTIPVTVKMHLAADNRWQVYDVMVLGISLVGNYRAQFNHIIRRHSYEEVIRIMKEKTAGHIGCAG